MKCEYLNGENIRPFSKQEAMALIGKRIGYLCGSDIDRTGRGMYFPRSGMVEAVAGKNIQIDGDWKALRDFVEMVEIRASENGHSIEWRRK